MLLSNARISLNVAETECKITVQAIVFINT